MARNLVYLTLFICLVLVQNIWSLSNGAYREPNTTCRYPACTCCREPVTCWGGACGGQCITGIFGNRCLNDCPSNCVECKDPYNPTNNQSLWGVANCTSCQPGYYSTSEYFQCQFHCTTGCATCTSATDCTSCKDGYYLSGTSCYECSIGCAIQNQCNPQDGSCKCKPGFAGVRCDQCAPNIQTYPVCDQCIKGIHGTECNQNCSANCNDSTCDRNSGLCTKGCYGNFAGVNCASCITGWRGTQCDLNCHENCGDVCDQFTGYCKSCKSNFAGNTCTSCSSGFYGNACNLSCPSNCGRDVCDNISGHCITCIPGFSGDRCCLNGSSCQSCSLDSVCSECVPGMHGENCGLDCPKYCADKICHKVNGTCVACVGGFHGTYCHLASIGLGPGVPVAAIAGGVAGVIVVITVVVVIIVIFFKRRSINKNNEPKTIARTDDRTTDTVYVNDVANIAASKEASTYNTGTNTYDIIRNMEPPSFGVSLNKGETRSFTTETLKEVHTLDASVKSDKVVRLDKSVKPDKSEKSEKAVKLIKHMKAAQTAEAKHSSVFRMDNEPGYESFEDDNDYYNSEANPEKGIPVSELAVYVDKKESDSFNNEYAKLPKGLVKSTDAALLDQNLSKNRYNAIYPYDETRVVLAGPGLDFINACYIEGYRKKRRYIASLGPIAKATEGFKTFWRMVWQEKTEKIVMVTNLMESGGMKCEQYWPDKNVTLAYGDIKVTCHSEDVYAEYTVRSFTICKKKEQRSLHHIHYTAWPDKGVPDDITSLVEFRNKVNSTKTTLCGPIIVHCSAGVGRTGTYIALDILTLKGERTGFVDIVECVSKLRQQRTCMVQTAEQYEYLHRALVHTLTFESEAIPADHFMAYTASLRDHIFDRLSDCTEKISTEEMEAIDRNKAYAGYNRPGADIPGDNNRPRLYYGRTTEDNDYINALFVNSFKRKNQFILTQTPLPNTVDDFLSLVVQENCRCIVSMDAADLVDKTIGTYLPPDNQTLTTETYEVRIKKLDSNHIYSQRTITITSKNTSSTVTVQHFRCTNWSDNDKTPKSPSEFLTLVKQIQKVADETTQFSPIIIHCRTGSERSALPCVVLSLLQKIEIEHEVSVINTVRQVKFRRSKSIPNKEQFKFCHQCVSAYLQTFDIYSNFS